MHSGNKGIEREFSQPSMSISSYPKLGGSITSGNLAG